MVRRCYNVRIYRLLMILNILKGIIYISHFIDCSGDPHSYDKIFIWFHQHKSTHIRKLVIHVHAYRLRWL